MYGVRILAKPSLVYKNEHHNVRKLFVLQKLYLTYNLNLLVVDIVNNIKLAYTSRQTCKLMAESLSLEYRTKLVMVKEEI